jgi:hypothetical protein
LNDNYEVEEHPMQDESEGIEGSEPTESRETLRRRTTEQIAQSVRESSVLNGQFEQSVAGLRFKANPRSLLRSGGLRRAFQGGLQPFGHWLDTPGFVGVEGMKEAMTKADPQALWAIQPFCDVCDKRGLHPVGRLDEGDPGTGHAVLSNPEFTIQLLKLYDDNALVGVQWKTHHNPELAGEVEVIGVRMLCLNLNLWGSILGRFVMTAQDKAEVVTQYSELLDSAVERAPILCGLIEQADETQVDEEEAFDAITGTGVGAKTALFASSMVDDTQPRTLWTTYNGLTRYATYALQNDLKMRDDVLRRAVRLLTEPLGRLSSRGSKAREALVTVC